MSGTVEGGAKAARTNRKLHGEDFYREIGKKSHAAWVRNGRKPRGFSVMPKWAVSAAGKKGGRKSRRPKTTGGVDKCLNVSTTGSSS